MIIKYGNEKLASPSRYLRIVSPVGFYWRHARSLACTYSLRARESFASAKWRSSRERVSSPFSFFSSSAPFLRAFVRDTPNNCHHWLRTMSSFFPLSLYTTNTTNRPVFITLNRLKLHFLKGRNPDEVCSRLSMWSKHDTRITKKLINSVLACDGRTNEIRGFDRCRW